MSLIRPISKIGPTYCPKCNKDNAIEIFSIYDKPIGYIQRVKFMKESDLLKYINDYNAALKYCKCMYCKSQFEINWLGKLPRPFI